MTAVVGILNKQAVAIAADSAVTISSFNGADRKIFNRANKIFTLSKRHPVGIMLYNSASFMTTPWETIIKVYRQELGDRSFDTLREYQEDFIKFLYRKEFYSDEEMQSAAFKHFTHSVISTMINQVIQQSSEIIQQQLKDRFLSLLDENVTKLIESWKNEESCPDLENYTQQEFETYSRKYFSEILEVLFTANGIILNEEITKSLKELVYYLIKSKEENFAYTGLIFTGFGDKEIYPQLISLNVSLAFDGRLRYFENQNKSASISNTNNGVVCPFAQTDVIDTILSGVDPSLDRTYLENFEKFFQKYNEDIIANIEGDNTSLEQKLRNLDVSQLISEFNKNNQEIKLKNYIHPLMNAVSNLAKDDLAEMAESLIYLTYLKRRITFAEESVGGPVDVAIISKGDGFIWIKRKHYFKPELNQHFFNNYFK